MADSCTPWRFPVALELADFRDGFPVSLAYMLANPAASATTAMTCVGQGGAGFQVPTGYTFYPMAIFLTGNAAVAAGTITAKVTDSGTILAPVGPEAGLESVTNTTRNSGVARRLQDAGIAAGHYVGVKLVADGSYSAATIDYDCVVSGVLVPA